MMVGAFIRAARRDPSGADRWDQVAKVTGSDVRLTVGGEPTFVSIDNQVDPEWTTDADGPHKRQRASDLAARLKKVWAPQGLVQRSQGKWYPGEQLPRWSLNCFWRADGEPIWRNPHLYFQIGFCPEQDAFYERMTGLEWVTALVRLNGLSEPDADAAAIDAEQDASVAQNAQLVRSRAVEPEVDPAAVLDRVRAVQARIAEIQSDQIVETLHDAKASVSERIDSAREAVDLKRRQVTNAVDAGRTAGLGGSARRHAVGQSYEAGGK